MALPKWEVRGIAPTKPRARCLILHWALALQLWGARGLGGYPYLYWRAIILQGLNGDNDSGRPSSPYG